MRLVQKGMSLIETIVGVGLLSGVILGYIGVQKFSGQQKIMTDQNTELTNYIIHLKKNLSVRDSCNEMVSLDGSGQLIINWNPQNLALDYEKSGLLKTNNDIIDMPTVTTDDAQILPINVLMEFERESRGIKSKARRKLTFHGLFKNQVFIECVDYETISIASLIKISCENLGARFEPTDIENPTCDFSEMTKTDRFPKVILKEVCEKIYMGTYDELSGLCNKIEITNGPAESVNLKENKVRLKDDHWRERFNMECPNQQDMFVKGFSASGVPKCLQYQFCSNPGSDSSCAPLGQGI
ncbi:MAG: hypothetical protein H6622_02825 [Halobacteriovoraceae bacterium]|nr:hypothetical protein [Halobacteriovoraceae bacterium]